jgi:hypothetical protein
MLDFGLSDAHQDAGGKSEIAPFILAEDTEGLESLQMQPLRCALSNQG